MDWYTNFLPITMQTKPELSVSTTFQAATAVPMPPLELRATITIKARVSHCAQGRFSTF